MIEHKFSYKECSNIMVHWQYFLCIRPPLDHYSVMRLISLLSNSNTSFEMKFMCASSKLKWWFFIIMNCNIIHHTHCIAYIIHTTLHTTYTPHNTPSYTPQDIHPTHHITFLSSQTFQMFQPATVSRCGMIYLEPSTLGWRPIMKSWLNTLPQLLSTEYFKSTVEDLLEWLVDPCLVFVRKSCKVRRSVTLFTLFAEFKWLE